MLTVNGSPTIIVFAIVLAVLSTVILGALAQKFLRRR